MRPRWPKKKDKKAKEPTQDDVVGPSGEEQAVVQRIRRNSCPNAKEMAEAVEVVVDMVVEAQKKAVSNSRPTSKLMSSRPTSRLIPLETSGNGGGEQTSRPLSLRAVTDEALSASALISTQVHDSRSPRRTSSWVVLNDETTENEESEAALNNTNVSANQAVIEATRSFVSSLFPWAVDMVLKNENIKETTESASINEKEVTHEEEDSAASKIEESSENDEFAEALGEIKDIKANPSFSEERRPSLFESLWAVVSPSQEYATPMESPEISRENIEDGQSKLPRGETNDDEQEQYGALLVGTW